MKEQDDADDADETSDTMLCVHCGTQIQYSDDSLLCERCFVGMWSNPDEYEDDADSWEGTLLKRAAKKSQGRDAD